MELELFYPDLQELKKKKKTVQTADLSTSCHSRCITFIDFFQLISPSAKFGNLDSEMKR